MSFKFRLQRVLELREKAEQARALALRDAKDHADSVRTQQEAMHSLRTLQREGLDAAARGLITAGELQHLSFVIAELDARLARATEDVTDAERVAAEAQAALFSASRDRRVLDRLKSRHAERWQDDAMHRDRLHMDEIALSRFSRARSTDRADEGATTQSAGESARKAALTPPVSPAL